MKKKLSALLLSAVLCMAAMPMNGMAADFSDDMSVVEDISEAVDETSTQEETENSEETEKSEEAETIETEEAQQLEIGEAEQAYAGKNSENFTDSEEDFSDGEVTENGNIILSHEGIIQEGAISPKKTSAVLTDEWESSLIKLVEGRGSVLNISELSIPAEQISDVLMLFINRHPEYYWLSFESCDVENGIAVTLYEDNKPSMGRSRSAVFGASSFEEATEKALAVVQPGMSDLEKALALHDYIVLNTEYDYQGVLDNNLPYSVYTAEGILVEGKGVCQGYALAYQYLLKKVGIESKYVASTVMNHGWNLVKIGGQWYHVDATSDDPVWDQLGRVRHSYFMLSDSAITRLGHHSWEVWDAGMSAAPAATSEIYNNFFWKNINTGIWYYQGKWYYMDINTAQNTDVRVGKIKCQKIQASSATVLCTLSMKWPYVGNPNAYWGNSAKTVLYNGKFYYSGPDAIYRMNLDGTGTEKVADVKYTNRYVYGFAFVNNAFWVSVKENPNIAGEETPIKITLKSSTTSKPTAAPTPKTTPKPVTTDLKKYGELKLPYTSMPYTGTARKMKIQVRDKSYKGGKLLSEGTNYKVSWKNNVNAGTAVVTVTGTGKYKGVITGTFKIVPGSNKITASDVRKTQNTKKQIFSLGAKDLYKAKLTYKSNNKNVAVDKNGKVTIAANFTGTAAITITSAVTRNYKAARKTVTVTVNPSAVSFTKYSNVKTRKLELQWRKNSYVTGYEIQYSTNKSFRSGVKTKVVTKASTTKLTVSGLTKNKTYYVKIRTYKTVAGKKYYSSWSGIKTVKITK